MNRRRRPIERALKRRIGIMVANATSEGIHHATNETSAATMPLAAAVAKRSSGLRRIESGVENGFNTSPA